MSRYILTIIGILSLIFVMTNKANACEDEKPTPSFTWEGCNVYRVAGTNIPFDASGSSDDELGEDPQITQYAWTVWQYDDGWSTGYTYYTSDPEWYFPYYNSTGIYYIALDVMDNDEYTWSDYEDQKWCYLAVFYVETDTYFGSFVPVDGVRRELDLYMLPNPTYFYDTDMVDINVKLYMYQGNDKAAIYTALSGGTQLSNNSKTWYLYDEEDCDDLRDNNLYLQGIAASSCVDDIGILMVVNVTNTPIFMGHEYAYATAYAATVWATETDIAYGAGMDFGYEIEPYSPLWQADYVEVYIENSQSSEVYYYCFTGQYSGSDYTYEWDGRSSDWPYNYLPAGTYRAYMKVLKQNTSYTTDYTDWFSIVSVGGVKIYADSAWHSVSGSTITLLKGTKYTFTATPNPSGASWPTSPTWSGYASGTGDSKEVSFNYCVGTYLTVKCGSYDDGKTVYINVVAPEPDQISFSGVTYGDEHLIYGVTDPVWKRESNPNNPACYTMGKPIRVHGKFWASESLTYPTTITVGISSSWGFADDNISLGTSWPSDSTHHNSTHSLGDYIGQATISLNWQYKVPGGASPDTWIAMVDSPNHPITTTHTIYKVYGAPTGRVVSEPYNYTASNIQQAVNKINTGSNSEEDIATSLYHHVWAGIPGGCICKDVYDLGFQVNFDAAMGYPPTSGQQGMCCCRATGMNYVLQVLGIGPYTLVFCNEKPESTWGTVNHSCQGNCTTHGDVWRYYGPVNGLMRWEGAIRSGGTGTTCYAPGANGPIGTYDYIASYYKPYHWVHWIPPNGPYEYCTSSCNSNITGRSDGDWTCNQHSSWWDRFE
jgi:hypothetical protein